MLFFGIGVGFIVIVLLTRIYVTCNFVYTTEEQEMTIRIYLFRLQAYKKIIHFHKENAFIQVERKNIFRSLFSQIQQLVRMYTILLQYTNLHYIQWQTDIGTGEASQTGIVSGGIWGIKSTLIQTLANKSNLMKNESIHINVIPNYNQKVLQSVFDCMVSINAGKAMLALYKLGKK